jgi:hypothetical protein
MDLRSRLRKLLNVERETPRWRLAALRIIDPVEWYMVKDESLELPRHRGHQKRSPDGRMGYAPLEHLVGEHDVLPPTPDGAWSNIGSRRLFPSPDPETVQRELEATLRRREALGDAFGPRLEAAAHALTRGSAVTIETTAGTVRSRLIRFWSGAVLEIETISAGSTTERAVRIERGRLGDPLPMLKRYLAESLGCLGPEVHSL